MGMSASQARYLSLTAQQTNLEFQGQQINQERTILSQQVSDLYNNLLNMSVPTPPSTQDYTKVEYAGKIGATKYNFDASSVKPGANNTYIVRVNQSAYGNSLQKNVGVASVAYGTAKGLDTEVKLVSTAKPATKDDIDSTQHWVLELNSISTEPTTVDPAKHWVNTGTELRPATSTDKGKGYAWFESTGVYRRATETDYSSTNLAWFKEDPKAATPDATVHDEVTVNGHPLFTLKEAIDGNIITSEQKQAYEAAIDNAGLKDPEGKPYPYESFYLFLDDNGNVNFVIKPDIDDKNNNATTFAYVANGEYDNSKEYADCKLSFDPENGRITELSIPNYAADGKTIVSYSSMEVSANTVTDELAYSEAMAQYEYDQHIYDKKQQEINKKTEIIQQQDRNLELKLQRLDTQRTQITTEIEAVKKVMNDNIESSFKAFSG